MWHVQSMCSQKGFKQLLSRVSRLPTILALHVCIPILQKGLPLRGVASPRLEAIPRQSVSQCFQPGRINVLP